MVEFAIVLPVLLLLVFGIIDFGRALYTLNNLTSAVREGARYASAYMPDPSVTPGATAAIQQRVRDRVVAFGGNPGNPTVNVSYTSANGSLQSIRVEIANYPFTPITPLANLVGLGSIRFRPSATFRWEGALPST
jgi:Flp pilus assembly protein TadG